MEYPREYGSSLHQKRDQGNANQLHNYRACEQPFFDSNCYAVHCEQPYQLSNKYVPLVDGLLVQEWEFYPDILLEQRDKEDMDGVLKKLGALYAQGWQHPLQDDHCYYIHEKHVWEAGVGPRIHNIWLFPLLVAK